MTVTRVRASVYIRPGRHRIAERLWTIGLIVLVLAGLDQLSHVLAVGVLLVGIGCWAAVAISKAVR